MSRAILILGESGSGKTTSLRTLDPQTTMIIDADRKGLSWKGWKKTYSIAQKNYFQTSDISKIERVLTRIDEGDLSHIDTVVIDTINACMIDDELARMKEKGFDKWISLVTSVWNIITKASLLRSNLTVIIMAHTQTESDETGYRFTRIKTSGRKLDKYTPESKFTTVLLAKKHEEKYVFETQANNSTAKSPMDCFDAIIPNDMKFVVDTLKRYEEGD